MDLRDVGGGFMDWCSDYWERGTRDAVCFRPELIIESTPKTHIWDRFQNMLGCAQNLAKTTGPVSAPEERGNDPEAVHSGHRPIEFNPSATGAGRAKPHFGQLGEPAQAYGRDHPRRVPGLNRLGCQWSLKNRPHRYFRTKLGDSLIRESLRVHD